ncbi:MAG: hypothetical protein K0R57_5268 [Paenibacillaceae bacterium]|jgi:hypothetical protein|nr:hypothetical protein [Paenibacillaceae bacterium]
MGNTDYGALIMLGLGAVGILIITVMEISYRKRKKEELASENKPRQ